MAWEHRGRRRYYFSAIKRDGRVVKTYHGHGAVGELAAGAFAHARRVRAGQIAALATERARLAPLLWAMATLDDACRLMIEASLTIGGYHRYDGHWRRRRVRVEDRGVVPAAGRG